MRIGREFTRVGRWAGAGCIALAVACAAIGCSPDVDSLVERERAKGNLAPEADKPAEVQPEPAAEQPPAEGEDRSIINKETDEVLDAKVALAKPNFVIVENKVQGNDPLTVSVSAYISKRAEASTFGMQRAVQLHKAQYEQNPTYDEFMKMMRENQVSFAKLPYYQTYAYDQEKGGIIILQDTDKKPLEGGA